MFNLAVEGRRLVRTSARGAVGFAVCAAAIKLPLSRRWP
ncbi:hypothetical protein WQQ_23810 [Hydrocarboniphaga effusa AP103]|uniref:Uncharacterized protein n=1 Tax=Hydrocarboniphaga effusa AP103 TaxID=1172194 RepID=I7ZJX6_9GAMM|nr:hypothetical protein WQQ_23810 [Hydrocarboniphaga effusa AP103]